MISDAFINTSNNPWLLQSQMFRMKCSSRQDKQISAMDLVNILVDHFYAAQEHPSYLSPKQQAAATFWTTSSQRAWNTRGPGPNLNVYELFLVPLSLCSGFTFFIVLVRVVKGRIVTGWSCLMCPQQYRVLKNDRQRGAMSFVATEAFFMGHPENHDHCLINTSQKQCK